MTNFEAKLIRWVAEICEACEVGGHAEDARDTDGTWHIVRAFDERRGVAHKYLRVNSRVTKHELKKWLNFE